MRFHDFLDALARVAETKALPRDDQLLAADSSEGSGGGASPTEYINLVREGCRTMRVCRLPSTMPRLVTGPFVARLKSSRSCSRCLLSPRRGWCQSARQRAVTMEAADTKKFLKVMSQAAIKMETRRLGDCNMSAKAGSWEEGDDDDTSWVAAHP